MTASDHRKMIKQLKVKPVILQKYLKFNAPKKRSCGFSLKRCRRCGRTKAHIGKYNLHFCRQCFREIAQKIGFKKYS
tara:strand:+ start:9822 stop:10052 length:231 start_codon:yes stop_codon:yes gene_type:complete